MNDNYIVLIVAIVISLLIIKGMIATATDAVYNLLKAQITSKFDEICRNQNEIYDALRRAEHSDATEGGNVAMREKKDKLLFDVAKWAIECGNGLSTSAVQRHFSVGYSRAGNIVYQLYNMGLCARSTDISKPRSMLIGMDELMQLERAGAFK